MLSTLALLVQDGRWDHMDGDNDGMWLWGTLMMLTWVALIGVVTWLILRHGRPADTTAGRPADTTAGRAHEILDERLASGDITPEEYRERRELLGRPPGKP